MSSYKFGLMLFILHDVFSQLFHVLRFFLVDFLGLSPSQLLFWLRLIKDIVNL